MNKASPLTPERETTYEMVLQEFSDALEKVDDWPSMDFVKEVPMNRIKINQDDLSHPSSKRSKSKDLLRDGDDTRNKKRSNSGLSV